MVLAIHQQELATGIHVSTHPEPCSHLPPHLTPLGCPRAPALRALLQASSLHWSPILHTVMYMWDLSFSAHPFAQSCSSFPSIYGPQDTPEWTTSGHISISVCVPGSPTKGSWCPEQCEEADSKTGFWSWVWGVCQPDNWMTVIQPPLLVGKAWITHRKLQQCIYKIR